MAEELFFPHLLDPKGVNLDVLLGFLSNFLYHKYAENVVLLQALDDFNVYSDSSKPPNTKHHSGYTLQFTKGSIIEHIHGEEKDSKWTGRLIISGEEVVGTFPRSIVRTLHRKEWTCRHVVDHIIKPATLNKLQLASQSESRTKVPVEIGSVFTKCDLFNDLKEKDYKKHSKIRYLVHNTPDDNFYDIVHGIADHFKTVQADNNANIDIFVWIDIFCLNHHLFEKMVSAASQNSKRSDAKYKNLLSTFLNKRLGNFYAGDRFQASLIYFNRYDTPRCLFSTDHVLSTWKIAMFLEKSSAPVHVIMTKEETSRSHRKFRDGFIETIQMLPRFSMNHLLHDSLNPNPISVLLAENVAFISRADKLVCSKVLKPHLGKLAVSSWYEEKKSKENKQTRSKLELASLGTDVALMVYEQLNWVDIAKVLLLHSAQCYAESLGLHHKYVAIAFQNLALLYIETGKIRKAISYVKKAIEIDSKHKQIIDGDLPDNLNLLANAYKDNSRPKLAEKVFHEFLIETKNFEDSKAETGCLLQSVGFNNLGMFLKECNRLEEAEVILKESSRLMRKCAQDDNVPDVVKAESFKLMLTVYNNLLDVFKQSENREKYDSIAKVRTHLLSQLHSQRAQSK